jgi:endonuclease/exonuclease/phosphatase family metal-dependent hydrolase
VRTLLTLLAASGCASGPPVSGIEETDPSTETEAPPDSDPAVDSDPEEPPQTLVILTLNLHCFKLEGTPFVDHDARFAAIAAAVAAQGVTAIAAQEACVDEVEGAALDRLAAALQVATGLVWGTTWTPTHMAWEGTPDEAQEGVGLLTAGGPPEDVQVLDYAAQSPLGRRAVVGTLPGRTERLYTVHLDYGDAAVRRSQARQTAMHALVHGGATLIAGDYNARAVDPPLVDLLEAGLQRLSAASDPAGDHIDHVLAPPGFEALEARTAFDGGAEPRVSDHPGVLVRLRRVAAPIEVKTRLTANWSGAGALTLRGDRAPLTWELGWPAVSTGPGRWEAAVLGWSGGEVQYKWLIDDQTWESGDNRSVTPGASSVASPAF